MVDFAALENTSSLTNNNLNVSESDDKFTTPSNQYELPECPDMGAEADENKTIKEGEIRFVWTGTQQGLILGSYSYGVIVSLIGMASLARRLGHARVLGFSILGSSALNLLTPVLTEAGGYIALFILRACTGILTGHTVSQMFGLAGKWSPPQERSKIISFILAGGSFGLSCIMPVAGLLAGTFGWKSVFYASGVFSACWSILWLILIHETPEQHPRISVTEKEFITSSINYTGKDTQEQKKIPWLKIFKSGPFWCLVVVHFCSVYGRTTFTSMLPTYLRTVLKFDVETSGILSAVPYAITGILMFACGPLADLCISKGLRPIIVRKSFTCVGMSISCAAVVTLAYSGCNIIQTISMVSITIAMDSFVTPGFKACMIELAPEFSGLIFGMSATISNCSGILAPQITGVLRDTYGYLGWQIAFWMAGAIYLFGAIEFFIFGTNERQNWLSPKIHRNSVFTVTEAL